MNGISTFLAAGCLAVTVCITNAVSGVTPAVSAGATLTRTEPVAVAGPDDAAAYGRAGATALYAGGAAGPDLNPALLGTPGGTYRSGAFEGSFNRPLPNMGIRDAYRFGVSWSWTNDDGPGYGIMGAVHFFSFGEYANYDLPLYVSINPLDSLAFAGRMTVNEYILAYGTNLRDWGFEDYCGGITVRYQHTVGGSDPGAFQMDVGAMYCGDAPYRGAVVLKNLGPCYDAPSFMYLTYEDDANGYETTYKSMDRQSRTAYNYPLVLVAGGYGTSVTRSGLRLLDVNGELDVEKAFIDDDAQNGMRVRCGGEAAVLNSIVFRSGAAYDAGSGDVDLYMGAGLRLLNHFRFDMYSVYTGDVVTQQWGFAAGLDRVFRWIRKDLGWFRE